MTTQKFLIPDGIEYYTGEEARLLENLKMRALSIFDKYKYKLVITPVIDSLNNLTNLHGDNLKNYTTALSTKRDLGIRADITPQIARLDYQSYKSDKSNKYAYMGDIYREKTSSFERNNPFQIGAEYFGNVTDSIDINLIKMCCEIVSLSNTKKIIIDLNDSFFIGHYLNNLNLNKAAKDELISLVSMKSMNEIDKFCADMKINKNKRNELSELMSLDGPTTIIKKIKNFSKKYSYIADTSIRTLTGISSKLKNINNVEIMIDLSSSNKSMDYESGFNYSLYVDGLSRPIAVGGRYESYQYDNKSTRNATGFSIDLKDIINIYEK